MARVSCENITKTYPGNVRAVTDFSLEVKDGEFIVLVGPSGCGKSTVLRMIAGLEEITTGTIRIGDRIVNDLPPKERDIAMVFQNYALYPHMTAYENMAFGLKLRKTPKDEIDSRVREAVDMLGITDLLDRRPKALSGGQRQRVAVGRAIVRKPQVFLFDEPLSNLDAKMRVQMRAEISKLHARLEATMVYVTHDQIEAMTMGDRIVVMKDGIIQQIATPTTLYDRPANLFVAGFIGTPPMNFLKGTVTAEKTTPEFHCGSLIIPLPDQWSPILRQHADREVVLGIRPEHVGSASAENDPSSRRIKALVEVTEPTGSETYVYLNSDGSTLVARMDAHPTCMVGETLDVALQINNAHLFDAQTGSTLT
jgi:multiple sugar transport system ATP-binding protein